MEFEEVTSYTTTAMGSDEFADDVVFETGKSYLPESSVVY